MKAISPAILFSVNVKGKDKKVGTNLINFMTTTKGFKLRGAKKKQRGNDRGELQTRVPFN